MRRFGCEFELEYRSLRAEQLALAVDLALGRIDDDEFARRFGIDLRIHPQHKAQLLADALASREPGDVEAALTLCHHFDGFRSEHVPLLCELMLEPWHTRHEDIALALEHLADARSVDALYRAAMSEYHYAPDGGLALARKCTWALAGIGTVEARSMLERLACCGNQTIEGYARKRLGD